MAVSGSLSASALNTEFETVRANLAAHEAATPGPGTSTQSNRLITYRTFAVWDLTSGTADEARSLWWTPPDDMPVRGLILEAVAASTSGNTVNARLEAVTRSGTVLTHLLPGGKIEARHTSVSTARVSARQLYISLVGGVPGLLGGTTYRLQLEMETATNVISLARATLCLGQEVRR